MQPEPPRPRRPEGGAPRAFVLPWRLPPWPGTTLYSRALMRSGPFPRATDTHAGDDMVVTTLARRRRSAHLPDPPARPVRGGVAWLGACPRTTACRPRG